MKINKILKVFSLVVILHMALVVMLVMQPGCNSVSETTTVSMATPVGDSMHSGLWVSKEDKKQTSAKTVVKAANEDLTRKTDVVQSRVAYSEAGVNQDFVDLEQKGIQTASVYSEGNEHFEYTIKKGDSLWKIASSNGISMRKLMEYNGMKETDTIRPGQTLMVPGKAKAQVALAQLEVPTVTQKQGAKTEVKPVVEKSEPVVAVNEPIVKPADEKRLVAAPKVELAKVEVSKLSIESVDSDDDGIYEVAPGDSLYLIAMQNNTTVEEIKAMNGMEKSVIKPGQHLRIPGRYHGTAVLPEKASEVESFSVAFNDVPVSNAGAGYLEHEVAPGEYPGLIARKYGMSLTDLLAVNNISNPRMLKVGTKLKVINPEATIKGSAVAATENASSEKAVANNGEENRATDASESVSTINFQDYPVIRVGS